jgi:hypothetical protein
MLLAEVVDVLGAAEEDVRQEGEAAVRAHRF